MYLNSSLPLHMHRAFNSTWDEDVPNVYLVPKLLAEHSCCTDYYPLVLHPHQYISVQLFWALNSSHREMCQNRKTGRKRRNSDGTEKGYLKKRILGYGVISLYVERSLSLKKHEITTDVRIFLQLVSVAVTARI